MSSETEEIGGNNKNPAAEVLKFQVNRALTNQAKSFLVILEDLLEYKILFPYNRKRKIILDGMNNSIRELEEFIEKLEIKLKN